MHKEARKWCLIPWETKYSTQEKSYPKNLAEFKDYTTGCLARPCNIQCLERQGKNTYLGETL